MKMVNRLNWLYRQCFVAYKNLMDVYQNPYSAIFSYELDFWRQIFMSTFYALNDSYKNYPNCSVFNKMSMLTTYYERVSALRLNRFDLYPEKKFNDRLF